jgi:hypothetical protein
VCGIRARLSTSGGLKIADTMCATNQFTSRRRVRAKLCAQNRRAANQPVSNPVVLKSIAHLRAWNLGLKFLDSRSHAGSQRALSVRLPNHDELLRLRQLLRRARMAL